MHYYRNWKQNSQTLSTVVGDGWGDMRFQTTAHQSSIRFHCDLNGPKLFKPKRNNTPWTGQKEWLYKSPLFEIKPAIACTNSWFNISWVQWIYESWPVKTKTQPLTWRPWRLSWSPHLPPNTCCGYRCWDVTHPSVWVGDLWGDSMVTKMHPQKNTTNVVR